MDASPGTTFSFTDHFGSTAMPESEGMNKQTAWQAEWMLQWFTAGQDRSEELSGQEEIRASQHWLPEEKRSRETVDVADVPSSKVRTICVQLD